MQNETEMISEKIQIEGGSFNLVNKFEYLQVSADEGIEVGHKK